MAGSATDLSIFLYLSIYLSICLSSTYLLAGLVDTDSSYTANDGEYSLSIYLYIYLSSIYLLAGLVDTDSSYTANDGEYNLEEYYINTPEGQKEGGSSIWFLMFFLYM